MKSKVKGALQRGDFSPFLNENSEEEEVPSAWNPLPRQTLGTDPVSHSSSPECTANAILNPDQGVLVGESPSLVFHMSFSPVTYIQEGLFGERMGTLEELRCNRETEIKATVSVYLQELELGRSNLGKGDPHLDISSHVKGTAGKLTAHAR